MNLLVTPEALSPLRAPAGRLEGCANLSGASATAAKRRAGSGPCGQANRRIGRAGSPPSSAPTSHGTTSRSRIQVFLAVVFSVTDISKFVLRIERLATPIHWVKDFRPWQVWAIGALELLGAIGLVLPEWTGILPWLTPLAALGLAASVAFAFALNVRQRFGPAPVPSSFAFLVGATLVFAGLVAAVPPPSVPVGGATRSKWPVCGFALDMREAVRSDDAVSHLGLELRIGINSGPVVAGVIGRKRFLYDLWGDAVNMASRMESHGTPGRIQVTRGTYELLRDQFVVEPRGTVSVKGKGDVETWYLIGPRDGATASRAPAPRT